MPKRKKTGTTLSCEHLILICSDKKEKPIVLPIIKEPKPTYEEENTFNFYDDEPATQSSDEEEEEDDEEEPELSENTLSMLLAYLYPRNSQLCANCTTEVSQYNCKLCNLLLCGICLQKTHIQNCSHPVTVLNDGSIFNYTTLPNFEFNRGHKLCQSCIHSHESNRVTFVDWNNSRTASFQYCPSVGIKQALMDIGFLLSSSNVAFSINFLKSTRRLSNVSPTLSMYSIIESLEEHSILNRQTIYKAFLKASYHYKRLMIQIESEDFNEECMACPGENDTDNIHIAADGCFKLPRLMKPNQKPIVPEIVDKFSPAFVPQHEVLSGLASYTDSRSSNCANFYALSNPSKSKFDRFDETGVFGLVCARHGYPIIFTDMFKGESFYYPDSLLKKIINWDDKRNYFFYYDVGCSYKQHVVYLINIAKQQYNYPGKQKGFFSSLNTSFSCIRS